MSVRPVYKEDDKRTAESAVEQFHNRMNAEQYEAIYDDAHELFKGANSKTDVVPAMKQTHERTGKVIQVTEHWVKVIVSAPVQVRSVYNIKCENGEFSEWFILIMSNDGKKALLAQYQNFPGSSQPPNINQ